MGFPWYSNRVNTTDTSINWEAVNASFTKYFERIGEEGCHVIFPGGEVFVFSFEDMKFPNEDNWGDDEE